MSIAKRVTYLKGLAEGLGLGKETKEERILQVIIGLLDDISVEIADMKEDIVALDEDVSELAEGMEDLEDTVFDEFDEEEEMDGCCCPPIAAPTAPQGHGHHHQKMQGHAKPPTFYSVSCPSCENEITVDDDVLALGAIDCPNCGEKLEFDLDDAE